jgi:hypothetical protein
MSRKRVNYDGRARGPPCENHRNPVREEEQEMWKKEAARSGISFGSAMAIAISWSVNQSILWAILHGIFSWFYVIYFALTR